MPGSFTRRTVSTRYYRYGKYDVTGLNTKPRSDRGDTRKMSPEELLEAIDQVLPDFRTDHYTGLDFTITVNLAESK